MDQARPDVPRAGPSTTAYHRAMKVSKLAVNAVLILVVVALVIGPILGIASLIRF